MSHLFHVIKLIRSNCMILLLLFLFFVGVDSSGIRSIESELETAVVMDYQRGNMKK